MCERCCSPVKKSAPHQCPLVRVPACHGDVRFRDRFRVLVHRRPESAPHARDPIWFKCCGWVLLFIPAWLKRFGTEIAVTDRRVIYKTGLVQPDTTEINMAKIESVDVSQSILGRVFDFGTLTIRGTGETIEALRNIASPLQFRNAIMVR